MLILLLGTWLALFCLNLLHTFVLLSANYELHALFTTNRQKIRSAQKTLASTAMALNGAKLKFVAGICGTDEFDFKNHSQLLEYISKYVLPISSNCRANEFDISFWSDKPAATEVISSLMGQIKRSHDLAFTFWRIDRPTRLPVKDVENWLIHNTPETSSNPNGKHSKWPRIKQSFERGYYLSRNYISQSCHNGISVM